MEPFGVTTTTSLHYFTVLHPASPWCLVLFLSFHEFFRLTSGGLLLPPLQRETLTLTQADTVDSAASR